MVLFSCNTYLFFFQHLPSLQSCFYANMSSSNLLVLVFTKIHQKLSMSEDIVQLIANKKAVTKDKN